MRPAGRLGGSAGGPPRTRLPRQLTPGGEVETSLWFWLQTPHFPHEKANSEGTPARARGSGEERGAGCPGLRGGVPGASGEARDRSGPQSMEGTGRLHRAGTRIG